MQNLHQEKLFYHYTDIHPEVEALVLPRFYENAEIKLAHTIKSEFRKKYSKSPTASQMKQICKLKNLSESLSDEKIDALYECNLDDYDTEWLQQTTESWIEYKTLDASVIDLVTYLKTTSVTADNVKDVVQTAKSIISDRNNVDFKFDEGLDFFDPESHKQKSLEKFSTGYEFYDTVMGGGYSPRTLIAWCAAPKVGKSLFLCNLACEGVKMGYDVAYISLEMADAMIVKRLGSNLLNIKSSEYVNIANDESYIKKKFNAIAMENLRTPGSLRVKEFPTSSASTVDIENWLKQVEENKKIKFKLVFVDYVGIMKNWRNPNTENTYMKIKQIAEDLRAAAMRNNWVIITASQFNRCLALNTKVFHKINGEINIEELKINDEILTHNGYKKVLNVTPTEKRKKIIITTKSGVKIECSENHIFPTDKGELQASDLSIGMNLFKVSGRYINKNTNKNNGN